jgi:hypothetical protein
MRIMANAKPVAEVRIGAIKAAIWKIEAVASTRHHVTFRRIYKDGDDWKASQSFGRDGPARPGPGGRSGALAHLRSTTGAGRPLTDYLAGGFGPPHTSSASSDFEQAPVFL